MEQKMTDAKDLLDKANVAYEKIADRTRKEYPAITGRRATQPNIQNMPPSTPIGADIRRRGEEILDLVLMAMGHPTIAERRKLLEEHQERLRNDGEYQQLELRIYATVADMDVLKEVIKSDEPDKYKLLAAKLFDVPIEKVTPEMRKAAKIKVFKDSYGGS